MSKAQGEFLLWALLLCFLLLIGERCIGAADKPDKHQAASLSAWRESVIELVYNLRRGVVSHFLCDNVWKLSCSCALRALRPVRVFCVHLLDIL